MKNANLSANYLKVFKYCDCIPSVFSSQLSRPLIFQLINIAGSVLERPVIRKQFTNRYARILELLNMELSVVEVLFNRGTRGALINLPPLTAALTFTDMLRQRTDLPVQSFKAMPHPYVSMNHVRIRLEVSVLSRENFSAKENPCCEIALKIKSTITN